MNEDAERAAVGAAINDAIANGALHGLRAIDEQRILAAALQIARPHEAADQTFMAKIVARVREKLRG